MQDTDAENVADKIAARIIDTLEAEADTRTTSRQVFVEPPKVFEAGETATNEAELAVDADGRSYVKPPTIWDDR